MEPERTAVQLGGNEIEINRYRETVADRPTIVLLHEGLGSVSTWRDFPAALAARTGAEVTVYSRYGYGRSTVRREPFAVDYLHKAAREELPALLDVLGIERPLLVGHSDGASIALIFAGLHPDRVQGLVLEAAHVFTEAFCVASIGEIQRMFEASDDLRDRLARHHADPEASFRGWNDVWQLPAFLDWNIEEYLPAIRCPALVIQGADDEYGTLEQVARIERGSDGPVERLILDNCGHAPHRDRRDSVLSAMARFVERL